ncbi:protein TIC 214-like [Cryptotermes secundus]|uniref:protein TIC 214-like n=1 Tax=Cryptotermes secundus TaxID=105785 RepID=UPI001454C9ED|nr:protein TIC 214-like [Cryptotermes secundus]
MDLGQRISQVLLLTTAMALCFRVTTAQVIALIPAVLPPTPMTLHSVPVFATHAKPVSRPLQIRGSVLAQEPDGTEVLIGPLDGGSIVAAQINVHSPLQLVVHQPVPYASATGNPMAVPLKLLFTRFPPFIEAIVQRIQNYFSTYNHVGNENYQISTPENDPLPTTTTPTTPASTFIATTATTPVSASTTTTPTTPASTSIATTATTPVSASTGTETTLQPVPTNVGSQTENNPHDEHNSSFPSFSVQEGTYRHRYDPPASSPFKYPYPKTGFHRFTGKEFPSPEM